jgi:hypothetical protein
MKTPAVIAIVALGVAAICGVMFMQVLGRIAFEIDQRRKVPARTQPSGWQMLRTPTRIILRDYRTACPGGRLGRYLQAIYIVGGAAAIVFFADVVSLFR